MMSQRKMMKESIVNKRNHGKNFVQIEFEVRNHRCIARKEPANFGGRILQGWQEWKTKRRQGIGNNVYAGDEIIVLRHIHIGWTRYDACPYRCLVSCGMRVHKHKMRERKVPKLRKWQRKMKETGARRSIRILILGSVVGVGAEKWDDVCRMKTKMM